MQVQSLGREDPLEEGMATQLQYSGLENPMDRGAWRAMVCEVAKSQTQLNTDTHKVTTLCSRRNNDSVHMVRLLSANLLHIPHTAGSFTK